MIKRNARRTLVVLLLVASTLVAGGTAGGATFEACLVVNAIGVNDAGFNSQAWEGMLEAESVLGVNANLWEPASEADYGAAMAAAINHSCDIIVTIGFDMADVTLAAAQLNPTQAFAIVDFEYAQPPPNLRTMVYAPEEAAYLAGYVAAGMSSGAKVATYGAMNFPAVTNFMDGYYWGVDHYNDVKGTTVEVLGWDAVTRTGTFTNDFGNPALGEAVSLAQIGAGADILFPVAGPTGLGSVTAAFDNPGTAVIGVDTDWFFSVDHPEVMLTSVVKAIDQTVFDEVERLLLGGSAGGAYVGTVTNGGVGLAPYHDWAGDVPAGLAAEVEQLRLDVAAGETGPPMCGGLQATIVGTANADTLIGTPGPDVIVGFGGDDLIKGRRGDDIMCGGAGDDVIRGLTGNDISYGGPGDDKIQDGPGLDLLYGEAGKDKMWGGNDDDVIYGGEGNDQIHGGRHNDELHGGGGTDRIWGDSGNDTLYGEGRSDFLYGGIDVDSLYGGVGNDRLFGGTGNDFLYGETGRDQLRGQDGDDANDGGPQHDWCSFETIWLNCEKEI